MLPLHHSSAQHVHININASRRVSISPLQSVISRPPCRSQRQCRSPTVGHAVAESSSASNIIAINPADLQPVQCLKEWAPACAALGHGQQTILLRKGGIREPTFKPKARRFLLFPTAFHTEAQLLKPGIAEQYQQEMQMDPKKMPEILLTYFAEVTGAWTTRDPRVLQQLDALHVYAEGFLQTRLKWRSKDPLTLLELRCYKLEQQLSVPAREQYSGCFSWVELLPEDAGVTDKGTAGSQTGSRQQSWHLQPALADSDFRQKQELLRQQLQQLDVEELAV